MQILRTILIILVVYYAIKFISRLMMPYLVKKVVDKAQDRMHQQQQQQYGPQKQEGDVTVQVKQGQNTKYNPDEGEYVDFEEIKDDK